jgi:ParB family chromosome partitioning protein
MSDAVGPRAKRPPLGRGLAALFGEAGAPLAGQAGGARPGGAQILPIEAIRPSPLQPRRHFGEAELDGLAQSIREKGIVQPLLVRPLGDGAADFELVAGERRWRAAQRVGLHEVPVIIRQLADTEAIEIALVENLQREDLSPLEEAEAYSRLSREFGHGQAGIAEAVGKSRSHVANTLRLLSLPVPVRRSLEEGALSAGHARALLGAPDPAALAQEVVRRGLNVRATEELVRRRAAQPRVANPRPRSLETPLLERELGTALGLRVTVTSKRRGGALTVYFETFDQLDRVVALLRRG